MSGTNQRTIGPMMREDRRPEDLSADAEKIMASHRKTGSQYFRKERITGTRKSAKANAASFKPNGGFDWAAGQTFVRDRDALASFGRERLNGPQTEEIAGAQFL